MTLKIENEKDPAVQKMIDRERWVMRAKTMTEYYTRLYSEGYPIGRRTQMTKKWMRLRGFEGTEWRPERNATRLAAKHELGLMTKDGRTKCV